MIYDCLNDIVLVWSLQAHSSNEVIDVQNENEENERNL